MAYGVRSGQNARHGVSLVGPSAALQAFWDSVEAAPEEVAAEIPGARIHQTDDKASVYLKADRLDSDFPDDDARREWLGQTLNAFVNALRPRMKARPM
jgi:hypothetical protein